MRIDEDEQRRKQVAKSLGNNIFKYRREKGFTREELAEKSNLSANYIYGLENGTYLPGCLALIDLSNALNVTTAQLLDTFLDNKQNAFIEKISHNVQNLSEKDLNLILTIIDFCNKNN